MFNQNGASDAALLAALTGAGGLLNGIKIGLIVNNVAWSKATLLADLVEPTYIGYAQVTPTWSSVFVATDGTYRVATGLNIFQPTGASTDTITGYFVVNTGGTAIVGGDNFPVPIPLPSTTSRLAFTFEYSGTNAAQGAVAVVD